MTALTVVITNYNYAAYLETSIQSVLNQTYPHVRCVLVDDGSTDGSRPVAKRYANRLIYLEQENAGAVSAMVSALPHVGGDVVMFLDADDYLYPEACAEVVSRYRQGVSLVQFRLDKRNLAGDLIGTFPAFPFMTGDRRAHYLRHGYFHAAPTSGNAFSVEHAKRALLATDDARNGWHGADGYLIYSAPFFGEVEVIDKPLGSYLVHGRNVSLSSGLHHRSASYTVLRTWWQQVNIWRLISPPDTSEETVHASARTNMPPNALRNALLLRRAYPDDEVLLPEISNVGLALRSIRGYWIFPLMPVRRRLANMLAPLVFLLAPRAVSRYFLPKRQN